MRTPENLHWANWNLRKATLLSSGILSPLGGLIAVDSAPAAAVPKGDKAGITRELKLEEKRLAIDVMVIEKMKELKEPGVWVEPIKGATRYEISMPSREYRGRYDEVIAKVKKGEAVPYETLVIRGNRRARYNSSDKPLYELDVHVSEADGAFKIEQQDRRLHTHYSLNYGREGASYTDEGTKLGLAPPADLIEQSLNDVGDTVDFVVQEKIDQIHKLEGQSS